MKKEKEDFNVYKTYTNYVRIRVKNDLQGRATIVNLKDWAHSHRLPVRVRGRHHDRKALFAQIGREYCPYRADANDISFNSPAGRLCDEFVVYITVDKDSLRRDWLKNLKAHFQVAK